MNQIKHLISSIQLDDPENIENKPPFEEKSDDEIEYFEIIPSKRRKGHQKMSDYFPIEQKTGKYPNNSKIRLIF